MYELTKQKSNGYRITLGMVVSGFEVLKSHGCTDKRLSVHPWQSDWEQAYSNPKISVFRENKIIIQSTYVDKKGNYVTTIPLYPTEY